MLYQETENVKSLKGRLQSFMDRHVYPNEERFYKEAEEHAFWPIAWRFNYHQGFGVARSKNAVATLTILGRLIQYEVAREEELRRVFVWPMMSEQKRTLFFSVVSGTSR
jgi:hypothetical protein